MSLPICSSNVRNLLPSRASRNSHPATSRSTHVVETSLARLSRAHGAAPNGAPSLPNQVLNNESQGIRLIQVFISGGAAQKASELWVIESRCGGHPPGKEPASKTHGRASHWQPR